MQDILGSILMLASFFIFFWAGLLKVAKGEWREAVEKQVRSDPKIKDSPPEMIDNCLKIVRGSFYFMGTVMLIAGSWLIWG